MQFRGSLFYLLTLIPILFPIITVAALQPRIIDSTFDDGTSNGVPFGWKTNSAWADVNIRYAIDRSDAHRGGSLRIECTRFAEGAVQLVRAGTQLIKGHRYRIELWMKGNVQSPVELLLRMQGKPYTRYAAKGFQVSDTWLKYEFIAIAPASDSSAYFMIRFTSTGTLWVDDLHMDDLTNDSPNFDTRIPPGNNLLSNGGFEVGLDRWGTLIREDDYRYELPVYFSETPPHTSSERTREGERSLEVDIPPHGRFVLTSPYTKVDVGQVHSLSFWAMANQSMTIRAKISAGPFGRAASYEHSFVINKSWSRYSFSALLEQAPEGAYYVLLETSGPGRLWIDGVQLAEGPNSDFRPHADTEIGFDKETSQVIYDVSAPVSIDLLVSSYASTRPVDVTVRSTDYYGKTSVIWTGTVAFDTSATQLLHLTHSSTQSGYYRLSAEVRRNGEILDTSQMAIGIIRRPEQQPSIDSPFGNHARFTKKQLQQAQMLGVHWLRMHPPYATKWFVIEPHKGQMTFQDEPILYTKSLGFELLGLLDTTPRWASSAPANDPYFREYPPTDLQDWEHYVYETVRHYRGVIDYWEVWNEPNSSSFLKMPVGTTESLRAKVYTNLLKSAYGAAKRANPHAVIVGGCPTAQTPVEWFSKIFAEGAYEYLDVLSYHYYTDGRPGDALDNPTNKRIADVKKLQQAYGGDSFKPIWETESGIMYPATGYENVIETAPGYLVPSHQAASYVVRNYVDLLASGVNKWFYYNMASSHRSDRPDASGFFEWDGSPRPLAVAYSTLAWILGPAKYVRTLKLDQSVLATEFQDGARTVIALWKKGWGDDKKIHSQVPTTPSVRSVELFDIMGKSIPARLSNGTVELDVGMDPVYIVFYHAT